MERRHDEHQHKDDGRGDRFGAQLGHEMAIEEGELTACFFFQMAIALWGALQQQGITCLNNNLTGLAFDTMTSTGYSDKGHIMILLEMGLRHRATNERTTEVDIGGTHLALGVDIVDTPHMAVGGGKAVGVLNLEDIVDLTGIYQAVATHHPLVFWYWHDDLAVETHDLNKRTSLDIIESGLLYGTAHGGIIGRNKQLYGIVAGGLERVLARLTRGNELLQRYDHGHTYNGEQQSWQQRGKQIHRLPRLLHIKTGYDQI